MRFIKDPKPDPDLETFHEGLAKIKEKGEVVGYIATSVSKFWSPFRPFSRQWWVWSVIVWSDGKKERALEDHLPWSYVKEMRNGKLNWENSTFDIEWVPAKDAIRLRRELNIQPEDF